MKASELIEVLQNIINKKGDLEVKIQETDWDYGTTNIGDIKVVNEPLKHNKTKNVIEIWGE